MKKIFLLLALLLIAGFPARAQQAAAVAVSRKAASVQHCEMKTNGQVSINFNIPVSDLHKIQAEIDARIAKLQDAAREISATADVQNMNYNVYAQSGGGDDGESCGGGGKGGSYHLNGSASFVVKPAEKISDLLALLHDRGMSASMNVNSFRQCGAALYNGSEESGD
jgi:hypothetical protein